MTAPEETTPEVETPETDTAPEPTLGEILKERDDLKAALDKANKERAAAGRKYKDLRDSTKDTANEPPALSDTAKRVLVVTALKAEGLTASQASKLAKSYDLADVDVEDDEIVGIDFSDLRELFPQLFEKPSTDKANKITPNRNIDKGDKKNERNASTEEQFANALLRK